MKHLSVIAALVALIAGLSAPVAHAMDKVDSKKQADAIADQAQDMADRAERGRDKAEGHAKNKKKDRDSDEMNIEPSDVPGYEPSTRHDGSHDSIDRDERSKGLDNAATRGNETSQEMRARRDEGKAIKDEYKAREKSGNSELDRDTSEQGEKQDKKPWWKFWGD